MDISIRPPVYRMPVFEIAPATWRDLKDLHRLEEICFEQDAWPLLDLISVLTFPNSFRFKAVVAQKMAGFIAGDQRMREQVGWITTVCVLPDYRKQGIATALMAACETSMEMPRIRLCVRRSNTSAQHLYSDLGYQQVGIWKNYYTGREDALVYEKVLQP